MELWCFAVVRAEEDEAGALGLQAPYFLAPALTGNDGRAVTPGFVHQSFDSTVRLTLDPYCLPG